ncbi:MAG: RtcB family protein [Spartobacteria bacterium]|nr:RtcB family protein [Spartobacteria bacterium]
MKKRELINLGIPAGRAVGIALELARAMAVDGMSRDDVRSTLKAIVSRPEAYREDERLGSLARCLAVTSTDRFIERTEPAPCRRWGDDFEPGCLAQMDHACRLPIAVAGALMPDAHTGYGLPIGGVLAVRDAVIPYAVGMDIACRMKLSVLDMPVATIRGEEGHLRKAIQEETAFGVGAGLARRKNHAVMDEDWSVSPVTRQNKDKAWKQLGSSGSGNHFVEFGVLTVIREDLGLKPGEYMALLSHSGSRGTGGEIARHYSQLAMEQHPELPRELKHLAWFGLDTQAGREYWMAMQLMGRYAAANHELIHAGIIRFLKTNALLQIENHHNFAWEETHFGEEVVVHRKGAVPASKDAVGIIPGSMATPGYVVRGKGHPASMHSAAHGAGRRLSRTAVKNMYTWNEARRFLKEHDVELISAGLDEVPMGYKDIEEVMRAQRDMVEILARFDPKLVKMAP